MSGSVICTLAAPTGILNVTCSLVFRSGSLVSVRSAEATVANAEAQFVNAVAEEQRQRDLTQRNITPQAQFELIQRNRETADANLTRARASLRKAKDLLSFTQLAADFDGIVTARYAEPGQVVNAGQKVVTVARPEVREAVIAVPNDIADALSLPNDFTMTVDGRRSAMAQRYIPAIKDGHFVSVYIQLEYNFNLY